MASYKIYFLKFCYKNLPPSKEKCLIELQNATAEAVFVEKVVFGLFSPRNIAMSCRGTFEKSG